MIKRICEIRGFISFVLLIIFSLSFLPAYSLEENNENKSLYKQSFESLDYSLEQLPDVAKYPANLVRITEKNMVLLERNVIKVNFEEKFNSKTIKVGDSVNFYVEEDLITADGTLVLPKNTRITSEVISVKNPQWLNRNAKVLLNFKTIELPSGRVLPLNALIYADDGILKKSYEATIAKALAWPFVFAGAGIGIGIVIKHVAAGGVVGACIGIIPGILLPGQHYKVKAGKSVPIQLQQELIITPDMLN